MPCRTQGGTGARDRSLQLSYRLAKLWVEVPGKDAIRTFTRHECDILKPEPFLGAARDEHVNGDGHLIVKHPVAGGAAFDFAADFLVHMTEPQAMEK